MSIKALVDRGIELRAEMARLKKELENIEAQLTKAGYEGDHQELKDANREGRRWLAHGSARIVPVIFTADLLVKTFKPDSPAHNAILKASDGRFLDFFRLTQTYETLQEDGKKFRALADQVLGKTAPAFITACLARDKYGIPKSSTKVAWDDAEEISQPKAP